MSRWRLRAQSAPKAGRPPEQNEDRFAASASRHGEVRLALADGATNSYRSGEWAQLLVDAYVDGRLRPSMPNPAISGGVAALGEAWFQLAAPPDDAPWYVVEKAERGAFATLLGVTVARQGGSWGWRSLAAGDSELFHLCGGRLVAATPVRRAADFGPAPALLSSARRLPRGVRLRASGTLGPHDALVLASDALAAYLLGRHERRQPCWNEAEAAARSAAAFRNWVAELRMDGLADDDTTLITLTRGA